MTAPISIAIACIFAWCGFICAISFMESWLKFRAPGLTKPIGLGIGKLVFSALNKTERVFAMVILISLFIIPGLSCSKTHFPFLAALIILIIQTVWLLPALNKRAEKIINGQSLPPSKLHYWYIGGDLIKLTGLIICGISLLNQF